jgi:rRNA biogenesis protein RRP5
MFFRRLFKRAISLKGLSSKKIKFLFKKFLTFEKEYGDEHSVEDVKNMAVQYVEAKEQN